MLEDEKDVAEEERLTAGNVKHWHLKSSQLNIFWWQCWQLSSAQWEGGSSLLTASENRRELSHYSQTLRNVKGETSLFSCHRLISRWCCYSGFLPWLSHVCSRFTHETAIYTFSVKTCEIKWRGKWHYSANRWNVGFQAQGRQEMMMPR